MSKHYESAISDQLKQYLIDNNLFSPNQYGFRAQHSTELAALNIVDHLTYLMDQFTFYILLHIIVLLKNIYFLNTCSGKAFFFFKTMAMLMSGVLKKIYIYIFIYVCVS